MSDTVLTADPNAAPVASPPAAPAEKKSSALWRELKGLFWVLLAVLVFHSFVAKPFYIPSESMMPALLKGDRLVVSKYAYGWSWVSPTIPNPLGIFRSLVLRDPSASWGVTLPPMQGRLWGKMPERGDVVIVTPPGRSEDWIKRVIGLPGDTVEVRDGHLILNGKEMRRQILPPAMIPVDPNAPCGFEFMGYQVQAADGGRYCRLPIVRETLPNGVAYNTIDVGLSPGDNFAATTVPAGQLFLMGDDRDKSADSRFDAASGGLGGPVPWENIGGRAEFITFSLDGTTQVFNPVSWFEAFRSGRAGTSLRAHKQD
ncbi:signal peptidase I [Sphingomonas sp. BN140010]|uniref:Signal peptidase I n=1 Tax=Sphingomonas arvum TaxID=2992113 RepID=A0ABT3JBT0_9SPHN|nr:signal peptidase I [Sphingomonas sp. BN140010]MCW3796255.1 signal peptidase I [Sphingomonas sp. BN140010]